MTERTDQPEAEPAAKRGEAAWKAQKEDIATRNAQAKRSARELRDAQEKQRIQHAHAEELRERAAVAKILKRGG